jgi:signal transduction histidine kinase
MQEEKPRLSFDTPIPLMRQMMHDIRSPMNTLVATCNLLVEGAYDPLTPGQTRAVKRIERNSYKVVALLDSFLLYVRAVGKDYPLSLMPFVPQELIEGLIVKIRTEAENKGLTIIQNFASDLPAVLVGDSNAIGYALLPLLWNAVGFTETGTITVSTCWAESTGLEITVADTGVGIPHDAIDRIFEPFWRGNHATPSVPTAGCGLGLAVTENLAIFMAGSVSLLETNETGSTFLLRLPGVQPPNR